MLCAYQVIHRIVLWVTWTILDLFKAAAMKILIKRMLKLILFIAVLIAVKQDINAQNTGLILHNTVHLDEAALNDPYESKFFRTRGTPRISVKTILGDISVIENPELGGVQVDLYVERSFSLWSGTRSLDNYRIMMFQRGDHIIASIEDRRPGTSRQRGDVKFHFVLQVPSQASTELRSVHGNIILEGTEGSHFAQNQSGDLIIEGAGGEIRAVSTTGNIELAGLSGSIFAKTVNGNILVESNFGEVRVRTVTGNIYATDMNGTLVSATTSGNITADFVHVSQGIYMEAVSGDINLSIPSEFGYDIQGTAMRFDFAGIDQESISEQSQTFRERKLVLRNGGLPVQLSTVSGLIRVTETH